MPKDHTEIEAMVPPEIWEKKEGGTHAQNRALGLSGMIMNLGPTISYKNKVTQEVSNQPYKFDPEIDMRFQIIPGFTYNQWDLLSVFVTAGAPLIGAVAGATDHKYIDDYIDRIYARHPAPTEEQFPTIIKKGEDGEGGGIPTRGASSMYAENMLSSTGKGLRYTVGGPKGRMKFSEKVLESGDIQSFMRELEAVDAKWFKIEALGKDGLLKVKNAYRILSG